MEPRAPRRERGRRPRGGGATALVLAVGASVAAGCAVVGPASISNGRLAYGEVINATEDQQLLNAIVRERYGETFGMLTVASVTANVSFRASAGAEFQAWERSAKTDDLVPLSLGVGYEENPTISYLPVQGEFFLRQLVTPISVEEGFLALSAANDRVVAERLLYRRVNRHVVPAQGPLPPAVERLLVLASELREAGVHRFGRANDGEGAGAQYAVVLADYSEAQAPLVREFIELLGIEGQVVDGRRIVLPLGTPGEVDPRRGIAIETRSILEWLRLAGTMIELPAPHLEAGIVEPPDGPAPSDDRALTIRTSRTRPADAVVAIPFRGWWYAIDATDRRSKNTFRLLKFLVRLRLNPEAASQQVPVLTIPVG